MGGRVWAVWFDLVLSLEVIWGSRWVIGCCGLTQAGVWRWLGDQMGGRVWAVCGLTLC